ncbi:MAG: RCC1 domain-containing protein, partial [Gemmatimonadota bacterium]|nr:RCC1 domain-containing protein [Gemmatimonadota bacterium]
QNVVLGSRVQPGLVAGWMSWATIGGGQLHTCGVTASGAAYCWGDGQYGQLGSTSEFAGEPLRVTGF